MPKHIFKISVDTGSDTIAGSVKLSDALDSELNVTDGTASTPYATKQINDLLVAHTVVSKKEIGAIGSPTVYGHVRLNDVINRTDLGYSTGYAASVGAVSKVNEKVEGLITSIDTNITNINNTLDQLTAGQVITTVISLDDTDIIPVDRSTIFTKTITTDTTLAFEVPSTQYSEFWLYVIDGGSYNVVFPDNVKWNHSLEPVLSVGTTDILRFVTLDTGTTWLATQIDSDL